MTAQRPKQDDQSTSEQTVVVAAGSQLTKTALRDAIGDAGYDVVATPGSHSETVDALREHDPSVAVVAASVAEDDAAMAALADVGDAPIVAIVPGDWEPSAAAAVVSPDADRALAVLQDTEPVVAAVVDLAGPLESPAAEATSRWKCVMGSDADATDHDTVPVAGRRLEPTPTLLVGASTGGPSLVTRLIASLPPAANFRVLVVQHIREGFGQRLVDRLDSASAYDVQAAADGAVVAPGEVLVAMPGEHVVVTDDTDAGLLVETSDEPPIHSVRPAIDPTVESAADVVEGSLVAVQLTGMGKDGAAGIAAVREAGGTTIVQDPEEATVSSMPASALETGPVDRIVEADRLGHAVVEAVTRHD